jgi:hypothetical protein
MMNDFNCIHKIRNSVAEGKVTVCYRASEDEETTSHGEVPQGVFDVRWGGDRWVSGEVQILGSENCT